MSNLVFLGRSSIVPRSFLQFKDTQKKREYDFRSKLIKKAIYKCCDLQTANKAINFYRSAG